MNRRDFLKIMAASLAGGGLSSEVWAQIANPFPGKRQDRFDAYIRDYVHKMENFDEPHEDDVCLDPESLLLLETSVKRLKRLQRTVGHGNFHLLGLDESLKVARNYPRVGRFPKAELDFLEMIFYENAAHYGFFGEKPFRNLADRIRRRDVTKIPQTGNYIYKGAPLETYQRIVRDVGSRVVLTSGVRSITKQLLLFLNKACHSKGNLSLASRSLAPPGYSFHAVGDFDVGQDGFGPANFTERFACTQVFKNLESLGYVNLRYGQGNRMGVRFEPWHIRVT